jgi:hypothetical protein
MTKSPLETIRPESGDQEESGPYPKNPSLLSANTRWSVPSEAITQSSGLGGLGLAQAQDIVANEPKIRRTKSYLMPHPPA